MNLKKYNVIIEQPMVESFEVEAESIEQATEIGREKYISGEFTIKTDSVGTDAQIMVEAVEENERGEHDSTYWNDL